MKFRTEVNLPKSDTDITYKHSLITIGSCFAENIGNKFKEYRFDVLSNPFGVLYNPVSVYNSLKLLHGEKTISDEELIYNQDEWHSFFFHSDFSSHDKSSLLKNISETVAETREKLKTTDYLIITYGTSFVYEYSKTGEIVSNCHKIPAKEFIRRKLPVDELRAVMKNTVELVKSINSKIKVIFTVSPVRHWKDGAVDNMVSKAGLIVAVDELIKSVEGCFYFPSYEIVMDDLRDYRFYDEDLVHPNKTAVEYIWQKFGEAYFNESTKSLMDRMNKIVTARNHRVRNRQSESYRKFLTNVISQITRLEDEGFGELIDDDKAYFNNEIESL